MHKPAAHPDPMWRFEAEARENGYRRIAGIDEAGRGPLAGPVVSAAVILDPDVDMPGITDSKKLTPKKRDTLHALIREQALGLGVGICDPGEIDEINILQASLLSMKRAVEDLSETTGHQPEFLLVDGKFTIPMALPQQAVIKGDSRSISIAAASIIAKVTRDRIMAELDARYPAYGFIRHKGYPTKAHKAAIREHGPCPVHRTTFNGVLNP